MLAVVTKGRVPILNARPHFLLIATIWNSIYEIRYLIQKFRIDFAVITNTPKPYRFLPFDCYVTGLWHVPSLFPKLFSVSHILPLTFFPCHPLQVFSSQLQTIFLEHPVKYFSKLDCFIIQGVNIVSNEHSCNTLEQTWCSWLRFATFTISSNKTVSIWHNSSNFCCIMICDKETQRYEKRSLPWIIFRNTFFITLQMIYRNSEYY